MRPDHPATEDLLPGANAGIAPTDTVSDREFFHRFVSADRAEPGPEPAFILLHDSGGNEVIRRQAGNAERSYPILLEEMD